MQHLQRLSKRDSTTRLKALQALRQLCSTKAPEELVGALPAWTFYFKRVAYDNSKPVRYVSLCICFLVCWFSRSLAHSLSNPPLPPNPLKYAEWRERVSWACS